MIIHCSGATWQCKISVLSSTHTRQKMFQYLALRMFSGMFVIVGFTEMTFLSFHGNSEDMI
ncbi:hypothetical protein LINPERPRIM_LOCUS24169 [Linum perenne]